MANGESPLDTALDSIERDQLGGSEPAPDPEIIDDSTTIEPELAPRRPRGRPRKTDTRRSHSRKSAPASGRISGPPAPPLAPEYPPIKLESVAASIKQIDAIIVKMAGTAPITDPEAEGGAAVFGPVLDHYLPLFAEKGALWLAPLTWTILTYGPRAYEILDRRQRRIEAKKNGIPFVDDRSAAPASNGRASFSADGPADVAVADA